MIVSNRIGYAAAVIAFGDELSLELNSYFLHNICAHMTANRTLCIVSVDIFCFIFIRMCDSFKLYIFQLSSATGAIVCLNAYLFEAVARQNYIAPTEVPYKARQTEYT